MKTITHQSKLTEILNMKNRNAYKTFISFLSVFSCYWAHSMYDYLKTFLHLSSISYHQKSVSKLEKSAHIRLDT